MNANAAPILAIFEKKLRLEVPLFQRQYVWGRDQQWEPLWEDIQRKFIEYLEGRKDGPIHFLGAMVLDQRQTPTTHVEKRQVIDGQQRLTTLQIFLAAFRDFCRAQGVDDLAQEADSYLTNKGMMSDPAVDRFKVWPTQSDRGQFADVVGSGSRGKVEEKHPIIRRKYARKPEPRARMVEAYLFFFDQLVEFFLGTKDEEPLLAELSLPVRLVECFQALRAALQVVVIDLDHEDDAQVIFETLNARGEPLLPADLLRNFIFLRAGRAGENQEELYQLFWKRFDDPFWRTEVKQGRLHRPRSDLFLQHFLASRRAKDIPIKHLFVEYKHWITKEAPFPTIREELETLARQGEDFRRILQPKREDALYTLVTLLDAFDIGTAYPLLLFLMDASLADTEWITISQLLQSYLVRRAVCGYTTKNYNRVFLQLTRVLRDTEQPTAARIRQYLSGLGGESTGWPDDTAFRDAWLARHAYQTLGHAKIVYLFRRLDATYYTVKSEDITISGQLSVEHILPQQWLDNWPLPDGSRGMTNVEAWTNPEDERAEATKWRNAMVQTIGNLTILTQPLNSSISNSGWSVKRPALLASSLLPINQMLHKFDEWNEQTIALRGLELFQRAVILWPSPDRIAPEP